MHGDISKAGKMTILNPPHADQGPGFKVAILSLSFLNFSSFNLDDMEKASWASRV